MAISIRPTSSPSKAQGTPAPTAIYGSRGSKRRGPHLVAKRARRGTHRIARQDFGQSSPPSRSPRSNGPEFDEYKRESLSRPRRVHCPGGEGGLRRGRRATFYSQSSPESERRTSVDYRNLIQAQALQESGHQMSVRAKTTQAVLGEREKIGKTSGTILGGEDFDRKSIASISRAGIAHACGSAARPLCCAAKQSEPRTRATASTTSRCNQPARRRVRPSAANRTESSSRDA